MLKCFRGLLFPKLCWHIRLSPNQHASTDYSSLHKQVTVDIKKHVCITQTFTCQCADLYTEIIGFPRSTIFLERISPEVVYLCPPEKLVIEVKAKGRFREVEWSINGTLITNIQSHAASFSNCKEILFIEETSEENFGIYEISLRPFSPFQRAAPNDLDIIVTPPGLQKNWLLPAQTDLMQYYACSWCQYSSY